MGRKEELISEIMEMEWDMFSSVNARGGSAPCQEDPDSFRIIRSANFLTWSETTLSSYLGDLKLAGVEGRNLMTEKYARMEGLIPPLNPEASQIIERIVRRECLWAEDYLKSTPGATLARPIYARDETPGITSSETYSRAELETSTTRTSWACPHGGRTASPSPWATCRPCTGEGMRTGKSCWPPWRIPARVSPCPRQYREGPAPSLIFLEGGTFRTRHFCILSPGTSRIGTPALLFLYGSRQPASLAAYPGDDRE